MNSNWLERTELLVKKEGIHKLQNANILVVGLGGVGAFACEFLARAGVGQLTIVDGDSVDLTNKNRQLVALDSTIGKSKAEIMAQRIREINPTCKLRVITQFLEPEHAYELISNEFDYVADCIDSISPKLNLIKACRDKKVKLISSMGAGGVLDPSLVKVGNIDKTRDCPLARHIRKRMKQENICFKFKAVFSLELPLKDTMQQTDGTNYKRSYYGTISYMPAVFGIHMAATIVNYLLKKEEK
ncbi:tRNA threonylcarbamoyladenosine dehydratase [Capnocytophaga catalasegens]|uniref:tRNA threonylcarbamoyladenosine dehydratase n=1 Tax=Capnocytophaga catalasegens TaxID=1004260 RepID=A0AAV5AT86_9FLAO|nr:tRNA threonylcarbamoyladenosine dehydratase [Capnocytophaga catalasegens]GIZ16242.1 tRNA threonylcarbamoyladenosine dehydratase [Capnocytophaga catalasegens]GJM49470.1 tRNA threonylcarbamoyladenosine dehydratase [Capnocytophaga catalasegens]GJM53624.1 tRNA threonylcarbamoyladenosine dehydratase [Capnocytophaga catalasegens]